MICKKAHLLLALGLGVHLAAIAQDVSHSGVCTKGGEALVAVTKKLASNGDRRAGREGYKQVTTLDPSCPAAWFNLGILAESDHDWMVAVEALDKYLELVPNGVHAPRAHSELKSINTYLALPPIQREAAVKRDDYTADIERSRMFLADKLYKEAISEAARAQALDPGQWESYAIVSLVMARQNKSNEARSFGQMAIDRVPEAQKEKLRQILNQEDGH
jgi:tetratricopeptide (TPR) repeat protein